MQLLQVRQVYVLLNFSRIFSLHSQYILATLSVYSRYHNSFGTSDVLQSQSTTSAVGEEATSSEEIPAETLQCPLPEPSRAYPFCQENVVVRY